MSLALSGAFRNLPGMSGNFVLVAWWEPWTFVVCWAEVIQHFKDYDIM